MALTELEQSMISSLQRSQTEQTKTIVFLQQQVERLVKHVESLTDAYNGLYKLYSGTENES